MKHELEIKAFQEESQRKDEESRRTIQNLQEEHAAAIKALRDKQDLEKRRKADEQALFSANAESEAQKWKNQLELERMTADEKLK